MGAHTDSTVKHLWEMGTDMDMKWGEVSGVPDACDDACDQAVADSNATPCLILSPAGCLLQKKV